VVHGVGNRGRYRYCGELAQTLRAERARFLIELTDEQDLEVWAFSPACRTDLGVGWRWS
jgi:hypothetical protein